MLTTHVATKRAISRRSADAARLSSLAAIMASASYAMRCIVVC
jgi:hypothetical protein